MVLVEGDPAGDGLQVRGLDRVADLLRIVAARAADRFGAMEVTLFPKTYQRFGRRICAYGPYLVRGKVEANHRSIGITAEWLETVGGGRR